VKINDVVLLVVCIVLAVVVFGGFAGYGHSGFDPEKSFGAETVSVGPRLPGWIQNVVDFWHLQGVVNVMAGGLSGVGFLADLMFFQVEGMPDVVSFIFDGFLVCMVGWVILRYARGLGE
jgi:hypothetical protein